VSEFGDEFGAVEAERPDAHPSPPDADVAGFDVARCHQGVSVEVLFQDKDPATECVFRLLKRTKRRGEFLEVTPGGDR